MTTNVEQEHSRSPWMDVSAPILSPLRGDAETDVLVIGAGIAGLSTAYELAAASRSVMVLDRGRFGRGMTARTTAHLSFYCDDGFSELGSREVARAWREGQEAAVDRIEAICTSEGLNCDFRRLEGLLATARPDDVKWLKDEFEAVKAAGIPDASWLQEHDDRAAIRCPRQATFHPTKYLDGLTEALRRRGARLHDLTDVVKLEDRDGGVDATTGDGGVIRARQVVVATNSPFHLRVPVHTKQAPYRTYAIAAPVPKGAVEDVLFWDTEEPYHYVRLQPAAEDDLLIVGGEDHKSGTEDDGAERVRRLEAWMRERYPQAGALRYAWSGQVYEPADGVGFIGRSPEHNEIYVVTGDSGQGMTTGALAGLMLAHMVQGRESEWEAVWSPSRMMRRGLREYVKENVEAAQHWVELIAKREVKDVAEIPAGHGALLRRGGRPVAAFRDDTGELHLRSAVCSHAGCVVHWNSFERCWDCPCHGSQFGTDGQPLNAPAFAPLAEVDTEEHRRPGADTHLGQQGSNA
jgi:glycine/D-amino acid oxidase-like deaminating enzyme/nitrite reductase/ring-hydroxylating ferredoxin subunit